MALVQHDASDAEVLIFTTRDGPLARLAHELKLRLERFTLTLDAEALRAEATMDPRSLRVVCARKDGRDDPGALSPGELATIAGHLAKDVLEISKFTELRFVSTRVTRGAGGASLAIEGELTLHGVTRSVQTTARREGGRWVAELRLQQPSFGIKPFSAMLGALRVSPEVLVRISVPAS